MIMTSRHLVHGVSISTIPASSISSELGAENPGQSTSDHEGLERRAPDSFLRSSLQPFYVLGDTVYGGFSARQLQLNTKSSSNFIGSTDFYTQDLFKYISDGVVPRGTMYGFAAHFDTGSTTSGYTFFKSVSDNAHGSSSSSKSDKSSRSIHTPRLLKRQDDKVQCRNQRGESALFSKGECLNAASKMASEKTALASCGGCQLVLVGPQGQLSSSNMPANDIQNHASNILAGCTTGLRLDSSNSIVSVSSTPIASNHKPNYVVLLTRGSGSSC